MTRWGTLLQNWSSSRGRQDHGGSTEEPDGPVLVEDYDGAVLLRSSEQALPGTREMADLARCLTAAEADLGMMTVVVAAAETVPLALWSHLGDLLDDWKEQGTQAVRLVVPGAGRGTPDRPALAQRIADAWQFTVIASEGSAWIVPGGSLFVPDQRDPRGGWWQFHPDTEPVPLGPRIPAPAWQDAVGQLHARTESGCAVEQIPAGVLLRHARNRRPQPGDLCYAVPVDPDRATVLVGLPGAGPNSEVSVDDLAALLAALPTAVRSEIRLAPGSDRDLLPAACAVADALGTEVELLSGTPLLVATAAPGEPQAVRPVLIDRAGSPTWSPFAESVLCRPAEEPGTAGTVRLRRWHTPLTGYPSPGNAAAVPLSQRWQVGVVRAGLALAPTGRQSPPAERPVVPDQLAVEVDLASEEPLDESFYTALTELLRDLPPELRAYAVLHAPGRSAEEARRLRKLAVHEGARMLWPTTAGADPDTLPTAADLPIDALTTYRSLIERVVEAANTGRHAEATALAADLEREVFADHGQEAVVFLQVRQIRAHVSRLAGQEALAAELYRDVAVKLLAALGPHSPDAEQAADNADGCWRAVRDIAEARRIAPGIIDLRGRIPGPDRRWLLAAERYRDELAGIPDAPPAPPPLRAVPPAPAPAAPAPAAVAESAFEEPLVDAWRRDRELILMATRPPATTSALPSDPFASAKESVPRTG
ncbi:hypothetical protein [Streptomyces sp. NPDC048527]|uniref:hypothetical protein n=1 Tax=Streptomyces sp. NPDC048527 TaxID=3365568 RepID=UPI00371D9F62